MKTLRNLFWIIVILLLVVLFIYTKNETVLKLFPGLIGIFAMLAIALTTFLKMDESTQKTVKTILESSQRQINEFTTFIKELKETNILLANTVKNLDIISEDVITQQKQNPRLNITFKNNLEQIKLSTGKDCKIIIELHNNGLKNANNPQWSLFFQPNIEIVDFGSFSSKEQGPKRAYPGFVSLSYRSENMGAKKCWDFNITIKIEKTDIGLIKIPFRCSCDNVEQVNSQLLIDFVG